jgi:phage-related protein/uncharacterized protein YukE
MAGAAAQLIVSIIGDMKALKTTFSDLRTEIGGLGAGISKTGKDLSAAGGQLTAGITVPIAAVAGGIGYATKSALDFDKNMNQVFTLLPGITKESMGGMKEQALKFSQDMGVGTEQVATSLYQAISAGVPKENVFDFIAQAQKTAVGGNADLITSVNGLSSVVNAYGAENITAAQASDIMFTGVRLGKTTIAELSGAFKDVGPIAANLKVPFGDVTAAIAAMTSQGAPTGVATTQLRQMLVELSKDGSATAVTFEKLSGKSFPDFIASGGTLQGAIGVLSDGLNKTVPDAGKLQKAMMELADPTSKLAQNFEGLTGQSFKDFQKGGGTAEQALDKLGVKFGDTTTRISDYFGSVEAGNAVMMLSGPGQKIYSNNLVEMGKSAGETDKAFKLMDEGGSASLDKLKASFEAIVIKIGEDFVPIFQDTIVPLIQDTVVPAIEAMLPILASVLKSFNELSPTVKLIIIGFIGLAAALGPILVVAGAVASGIGALAGLFGAGGALAVAFGAAQAAIGVIIAALSAIGAPVLIVVGLIALLALAWSRDWGGIREKAAAVWDYLTTAFSNFVNRLEYYHNAVIMGASNLRTNFKTLWDLLAAAFSVSVNLIVSAATSFYAGLQARYNQIIAGIQALLTSWRSHWNDILAALSSAASSISARLSSWYASVQAVFNQVRAAAASILASWRTHWNEFLAALSSAASSIASRLSGFYTDVQNRFNQVKAAAASILASWRTHWNDFLATLSSAASSISSRLSGFYSDVQNRFNQVKAAAADILSNWRRAWDDIYNAVSGRVTTILGAVTGLADKVRNAASSFYNAGAAILQSLLNGINSKIEDIKDAINEILSWIDEYMPHSPAKKGPFRILPNWDAIFSDPINMSLNKIPGNLKTGLGNVAQVINNSSGLSNPVTTNNYEGDSYSIGPNTLSSGMDIKKLIEEIERYSTSQRRARGYIL